MSAATHTTYDNHRQAQQERILEVARKLFIQKGIEQVTLANIAEEAKLTRATLYNYFSSKEDIAKELFITITKGWNDLNAKDVWIFEGTGYEQLEKFITTFFNYLFENPEEANLVAEVNYLYAKRWSVEQFTEALLTNLQYDRDQVLKSIHKGIEDGSLRSDIAAEMQLAAFFNFLRATIDRFGQMGDKVQQEFGNSSQDIFTTIVTIFLDGLRNSASS